MDEEHLYREPNPVLLPDAEKRLGGLYIGCLYIAGALKNRDLYGHIKAVVCIGCGTHPFSAAGYPPTVPGVEYHFVDVDDHERSDIKIHFDPCIDFIHKHIMLGSSVFVHCAAGVSRSASIVIAYLMRKKVMTYERAFRHLRASRPIIDPNNGFRKQLREYEVELINKK